MIDTNRLELTKHGTPDFPLAAHYLEQISQVIIVPAHWHPEIEILFMLEGEAEITVGQKVYSMCSGDIYFVNPEEIHSVKAIKHPKYYAIVFSPSLFSFHSGGFFQQNYTIPIQKLKMLFPRKILKSDQLYNDISELIQEILNCYKKQDEYQVIAISNIIKICGLLKRSNKFIYVQKRKPINLEQADLIKKSINYIKLNFSEQLTLSELSSVANMSDKYFCQIFRKQTGQTAFSFLHNVRVEHAMIMLKETNDSVLDISMDCGFENISFFIRKFKEITNMTPGSYRKYIRTK